MRELGRVGYLPVEPGLHAPGASGSARRSRRRGGSGCPGHASMPARAAPPGLEPSPRLRRVAEADGRVEERAARDAGARRPVVGAAPVGASRPSSSSTRGDAELAAPAAAAVAAAGRSSRRSWWAVVVSRDSEKLLGSMRGLHRRARVVDLRGDRVDVVARLYADALAVDDDASSRPAARQSRASKPETACCFSAQNTSAPLWVSGM